MPDRQFILTTPFGVAQTFPEWQAGNESLFLTSDPQSGHLGSGGGTIHALHHWRKQRSLALEDLSATGPVAVLHAGGQSRRLPAYAITGKLFLPLPGPRYPAETLLDHHLTVLKRVQDASQEAAIIVAAGDILVPIESIPVQIPLADVVILSLSASAEVCRNFGVCLLDEQGGLRTFLQKPDPGVLAGLRIQVDTGIWILSQRAVDVLARCCDSKNGNPRKYELYSEFGLSLGSVPAVPHGDISSLSCRAVRLDGQLCHLGTSRHLVEHFATMPQCIRSNVPTSLIPRDASHIWIESSCLSPDWRMEGQNVITGVPAGTPGVKLKNGLCLDIRPVDEGQFVVRAYSIDDPFRGPIQDPETVYLAMPFSEWLQQRELAFKDLGVSLDCDIHDAPIFPVLSRNEITSDLLTWLLNGVPDAAVREIYCRSEKISASQIQHRADVTRILAQAEQLETLAILGDFQYSGSRIESTDLRKLAETMEIERVDLPAAIWTHDVTALDRAGLFATEARLANSPHESEQSRNKAFTELRTEIVNSQSLAVTARPYKDKNHVTRVSSPVRLDLAGSWSDTPPFCLRYGGDVVNVAVTLRGQAPIEVFLRPIEECVIRLASVDLGLRQEITNFDELMAPRDKSPEFALARVALRIAGIGPEFAQQTPVSFAEQIKGLGGGLCLTMAALTPTGSGLGTSSLLAASLLAALSEAFSLNWSRQDLCHRTLVLEQLLGSGGGWQDQVGGMHPGVKRIQTAPGMSQDASVYPLTDAVLVEGIRSGTVMLYDTGVTRSAFDVLGNIVEGMFLNDRKVVTVLHDIKDHAETMVAAITSQNSYELGSALRRTWALKCQLDAGMSPPQIQGVLDAIDRHSVGYSLLGAGGGGFLLIVAKSPASADEIRHRTAALPGSFVEFGVCHRGLQIS